jgi:uncharacterized BrkB/YihY/UPF0761 family membrane protein
MTCFPAWARRLPAAWRRHRRWLWRGAVLALLLFCLSTPTRRLVVMGRRRRWRR